MLPRLVVPAAANTLEAMPAGMVPHSMALPLNTMCTADDRLGSQAAGMVDTSRLACEQGPEVRQA